MNTVLFFDYSVDKEKKTISFEKEFAANRGLVWDAWTKPEFLDRWWAPKPFQAKTRSMDFRVGGSWHYDMITPDNVAIPSQADFREIEEQKRFSSEGWSHTIWTYSFDVSGETTRVKVVIQYDRLSDLEMMDSMGFKDGMMKALGSLAEILEAHSH